MLSIRVRLLPWTPEEIAAWIAATITGAEALG
jgi:imidazolonepropionase-like amidohydrolase